MTRTENSVSESYPAPLHDGWLPLWLRWRPTSMFRVALAEAKLLNSLACDIQNKYVRVLENDFLNTIIVRSNTPDNGYDTRLPIIMVHGMGAGIGMWCKNLECLSNKRRVYAFDVLGFGRSSRPTFPTDPIEAENRLVRSIEDFRRKLNLNEFILVGHSFGGYLAFSYSLQHPQFVKHLVLIDPWGFPVKTTADDDYPAWARALARLCSMVNPLSIIRFAGPFGPGLIKTFRKDLMRVFSINQEENETVLDYIYHCNAQSPSGEGAFKVLNEGLGWAKMPMITRAPALDPNIPMTFIHGRRSWIDQAIGIGMMRVIPESRIDIRVVEGAGHHVYAEKAITVNHLITSISEQADMDNQ